MKLYRDRRFLVALLTLVYTVAFTPALIHAQPPETDLIGLTNIAVASFMYAFAFFLALRAAPRLFKYLTPVLFFLSAIAAYYMWQYRFEITFQQLAVVTEVAPRTAYAFITWKLIAFVLVFTFIGYRLAQHALKNEEHDPRNNRLTFIMLVVLVCVFTSDTGRVTQRYFPYNLLFATGHFVDEKLNFLTQRTNNATFTYEDKRPLTVILVIGESVRAANWGLNGYERQTTPKLAKRHDIINFTDVHSCFPLTRVAVPCILDNEPMDHETGHGVSIIDAFKKIGFFTVSIDMHGMSNSIFGGPVTSVLAESNQLLSFNASFLKADSVDDEGIRSLQTVLNEHKDKLFVFLHTFGSHWPFDTRYPAQFRVFKPACNPISPRLLGLAQDMAECVPQELVNAYDNSILYADTILDEVFKSVADRPALVVFTSDHGQSLGENGIYLHGHPAVKLERTVPMVFWASPQLRARYPELYAKLKSRSTGPVTHDYIFHTLLDCIGAKSDAIDPKLSLCR